MDLRVKARASLNKTYPLSPSVKSLIVGIHVLLHPFDVRIPIIREENRDPVVSGAVNIAVEFYRRTRGEYHVPTPVPRRLYRGVSYPWGRIEGASARGGKRSAVSSYYAEWHPG